MPEQLWYCTRQRAGPLVKESRALRPRLSSGDSADDRRDKQLLVRSPHTAVCRTWVDRLELRLALFGYRGTHYTLTFNDDTLPCDFNGVRRAFRAFTGRINRWRNGRPYNYIYCIEGLHGDHRYHIHSVFSDDDFSPAEIQYFWRKYGFVDDEPVLLKNGGYRRLAEYFNKERTDGFWIPIGRHPWSCSRSLTQSIPPPERWMDSSGVIDIPDDVLWARRGDASNDFGAYYYGSYILPNLRRSTFILEDDARTRASILKSSGKLDTFSEKGGEALANRSQSW